jgi:hypothetical protein
MRWWTASCLSLATLACVVAYSPAPAQASTPPGIATASPSATPPEPQVRRKRDRVRALELQGLGMTQLLPRPGVGGDVAFAFGHPNFQARVGMMVVGVPPFRLGVGEVANVLQVGTLDMCAAKRVLNHQIRMCMGGQAGGMAHRWKGFEHPGRPMTVWAAGTLKGDYQVFITKRVGIIGGVGMVIPFVGPTFGGTDRYGSRTPLVFPGPIAGFLSLGTSLRW